MYLFCLFLIISDPGQCADLEDGWGRQGWCSLPAGLKPCSGGKGRWTLKTFLSYPMLLGIGLGEDLGVFFIKIPKVTSRWPSLMCNQKQKWRTESALEWVAHRSADEEPARCGASRLTNNQERLQITGEKEILCIFPKTIDRCVIITFRLCGVHNSSPAG